jgi:hypothetical protein
MEDRYKQKLEYLIDDIQYELKRDPELEDVIKEGIIAILKKIDEYKKMSEKLNGK